MRYLARFRPSGNGREPLGRETVSKASSRDGFPTRWPALSKSAGLATSLVHSLVRRGAPPLPHTEEKRGRIDALRARRPVRRPTATDACIRCRRSSHRQQAISDRLSFCHHEADSLLKLSDHLLVSWCLGGCDVGGWAILCLLDLCRFSNGESTPIRAEARIGLEAV